MDWRQGVSRNGTGLLASSSPVGYSGGTCIDSLQPTHQLEKQTLLVDFKRVKTVGDGATVPHDVAHVGIQTG